MKKYAQQRKYTYMANILVVDDEMGIRELLSEILSDEGHAIETAENAQQARIARNTAAPDLVLLDIWMPDTDGVSLLKEWQRDGQLTMPVIMMSGHATIDTAVEATRIGALSFLEKPIALQKLLKAVQQGLSHGQAPRSALPVRSIPAHQYHHISGVSNTASHITQTILSDTVVVSAPPISHSSGIHGALSNDATEVPLSSLSFNLPLREARDAFERMYFEYYLLREGGSMTRVAEKTGLERTHLYRKLKQLGVVPVKIKKTD